MSLGLHFLSDLIARSQRQDKFFDLSASVVGMVKSTDPSAQICYMGAKLDQAVV